MVYKEYVYIAPSVYIWYVELDNGMRKTDLDQKCVAWVLIYFSHVMLIFRSAKGFWKCLTNWISKTER